MMSLRSRLARRGHGVPSNSVTRFGLAQGTYKRHHNLHVGQPHFITHTLQRLTFHGECLAELRADISGGATETEHRVFFFRLIPAAADQFAVFVALEVADKRTMTGLGQKAAAIAATPSATRST